MANVVIVCLLGKAIGYKDSVNCLTPLWQPEGSLQVVDLDNNYYGVKFNCVKDYTKSLSEGSWMIYKLQGLSYQCYTKELIQAIAAVIGMIIRIDYNINIGNRGKFAYVVIVVDRNKPFIPYVRIDGWPQIIEYEGLPTICYKCGCYGHTKEICTNKEI
ncbi:hypothetical protein Goari_004489 [Gossypium aridum]|uniref:DUF4283 domain-containing protein n=1 Tax=Gossypium aridum TaxID=34290 RepID=A0A7J8Y3L6_GOSAI|nr:hypothetical protein [Gossypium aridum]